MLGSMIKLSKLNSRQTQDKQVFLTEYKKKTEQNKFVDVRLIHSAIGVN